MNFHKYLYFFIIISLLFIPKKNQSNPLILGLVSFHGFSIVSLISEIHISQDKNLIAYGSLGTLYSILALYRAYDLSYTEFPGTISEKYLKKISIIHTGLCAVYGIIWLERFYKKFKKI